MDYLGRHPLFAAVWLFVVTVVVSAAFTYLSAKFEAEAYYRVTGKRVSTWDAVFLDLRVQESTK